MQPATDGMDHLSGSIGAIDSREGANDSNGGGVDKEESGSSASSSDASDCDSQDSPFTPKFFGIDEDAWTCVNCIHSCFGGTYCIACFQPRQHAASFKTSGEHPDLTAFTLNKSHPFASWSRPKAVVTGYCYDSIMEMHEAESVSRNGILDVHVERPDRVRCVNQHLNTLGLLDRMVVVPSRLATQDEICSVHSHELFSELKSTHGKAYIRVSGCPIRYLDGLYEASSEIVCGKPVHYNTVHESLRIEYQAVDGEWQIKEELSRVAVSNYSAWQLRARISCAGSLESCAALATWCVQDEDSSTFVPHPEMRLRIQCSKTGCSLDDTSIDSNTYVGPHSFQAAVMAVGCVLSVAHAVHTGAISNGIAVVRPPGHHAKKGASQGFCLLNNVAVAAKVATTLWGLERVAILDWDIHHGNGTEEIFYDDPNVLVINMHRYDNRQFYPCTGSPDRVGTAEGKGFNINIGWQSGNEGGLGDSDYLAAMRVIILPILEQFKPSLLFISAGFDAAMGDPLGRCRVTCAGYAQMTQLLSSACSGKVVVVIEGGYNLTAVANSSEAVVRTLLGEPAPTILPRDIRPGAGQALHAIMQHHSSHWSCLSLISHIMTLHSQHEARLKAASKSASLYLTNSSAAAVSSSGKAHASSHRAKGREHDNSSEASSSESSAASSHSSSTDHESKSESSSHASSEEFDALNDDDPLVASAKIARFE